VTHEAILKTSAATLSPVLDVLQTLLGSQVRALDNGPLLNQGIFGQQPLSSCTLLLRLLTESLLLPSLRPDLDFKPIVEALKSIHEASQESRFENHHYPYPHQALQELETTLRKHSRAVDQLLGEETKGGRTEKRGLHAVQQTLFLQCARYGKTAGRFRVANRTGKPAAVHFQPHAAEPSLDYATLIFEPESCRLQPEEAAVCRAVIDLSKCSSTANQIEMRADVYLNSELTLKLFVSVAIYEESRSKS
jgi:hypothetical protein